MAFGRSLDQRKLVLQMYERGNSCSKISTILGISQSTCHNIVRRFTMRGSLRDAHSEGRPQILDERGDCKVVRLNELFNSIAEAIDREL